MYYTETWEQPTTLYYYIRSTHYCIIEIGEFSTVPSAFTGSAIGQPYGTVAAGDLPASKLLLTSLDFANVFVGRLCVQKSFVYVKINILLASLI